MLGSILVKENKVLTVYQQYDTSVVGIDEKGLSWALTMDELNDFTVYEGINEYVRAAVSEDNGCMLEDDTVSALNTQHGGDHYKKLDNYQPWQVCQAWLTPEEFRGYMKGTAIAYLAREKDKGGDLDIDKAIHTLQALLEMTKCEII